MKFVYYVVVSSLIISCNHPAEKLPILGSPIISGRDTVYPTIAAFSFTNQDEQIITSRTLADKIYVADFIFLSCPTICPKMTREMHKAYMSFAADKRVAFVSYSIDPQHDSIPRLKAYADNLGVSSENWHFLTGNQDSILNLAQHSYFSTAYTDSTSPGGFAHSGGLLLVDKNRHIRGVYNSTKPEETQRLINDIKTLLKEQF